MNRFSDEEIKAAKGMLEYTIESGSVREKALYMAGEIVMWAEIIPEENEITKAAVSSSEHLIEKDQAFYIAGFQECIKYLKSKQVKNND